MHAIGVRGIERLSLEEIKEEIALGGRFVQYVYVHSYLLFSQRKLSDAYFIFGDESKAKNGLQYSLAS